jgi:4'-phosphopantetheinyl transferase
MLVLLQDSGALPAMAAAQGPLSASSTARLARIRRPNRARQGALARRMAAVAASHLLQGAYPVAAVEEDGTRTGIWLRDAPHLHVSISHSRDFVAVAVDDAPCGVDIECCDQRRDCSVAARAAFGAEAAAWIHQAPVQEVPDRFYLLWTLDEAAYKAGVTWTWNNSASPSQPVLVCPRGAALWESLCHQGYRVTAVGQSARPVAWKFPG